MPCEVKTSSSNRRRWVLYVFTFASVSLAAGVVYGWPALRRQLIKDGSTLDEDQLGAIFTVGAWSSQGGRFVIGLARDRWGTRRITCVCFICTTVGAIGVALSDPNNAIALGVSLFAMGLASGIQLCTLPVSGLFPDSAGSVMMSLTGAFQISGLVFLALAKTNNRKSSYLGFAALLTVLTVMAAVLLPQGKSFLLDEEIEACDNAENDTEDPTDFGVSEYISVNVPTGELYQTTEQTANVSTSENNNEELNDFSNSQDSASASTSTSSDSNQIVTINEENNGIENDETMPDSESSPVPQADRNQPLPKTFFQQLLSWEYIGLCSWFSLCLVPLQYYIGTIGYQLEEKGDNDGFYTNLFSVTYAATCVAAPVGGFLSHRFGLGITQGVSSILSAIPFFFLAWPRSSLNAQIIGMISYGFGRMFIFGMFFTNIGERFGYTHFGALAGSGLLISAIVSLLQYPLIALAAAGPERGVNLACGATLLVVLPTRNIT